MRTALVGATGFVGGNLRHQFNPEHLFDSRNIAEISGQTYDLLLFSGARAEKWKANQKPEEDRAHIDALIKTINGINARRAVLVSTVDVYGNALHASEDVAAATDQEQAYGRHRAHLELAFQRRFPDHLIIRLPALFGNGLKKNVVYDFIHENNLEQIDSRSSFQFYPLDRLRADIETCWQNGLSTVNFTTEPLTVTEAVDYAFGRQFTNEVLAKFPNYNVKTRYSQIWGRDDGYLLSKSEVLAELRRFIMREMA